MKTKSSFRYEADMTTFVADWMGSQGLSLGFEYPTPSGPCDIVGMAFRHDAVRHRIDLLQTAAILDVRRLALLEEIPNRNTDSSVSLSELNEKLAGFLDVSSIQEGVKWLVHNRFVTEDSRGGFQKLNGWAPLQERILAVELKLRRVWDAAHQAFQRLTFATEAMVALPEETARRLVEGEGAEKLKERGVGVLAVARDGCELLLPASEGPRHLLHPVLRALCVERFWRKKLTTR